MASQAARTELPLHGVRVLDLADGKCEMTGRLLADLGADVVLVEPPTGAQSRRMAPFVDGASLYFASHNGNKRSVAIDLHAQEGKEAFLQLVDAADILIETMSPGTLDKLGLGVATLHQRNPQLVVLSITDFGQTGPWSKYVGSVAVQTAMAGVLCRSGLPGSDTVPLLPPGSLAYELSAVQAAWVALISYWQRLEIGVGDHLDFSIFEGTAQIFDPILGVTGSAAAGKSALQLAETRGRPAAGLLYPIYPCKDGYVRMCILNPRQWLSMSNWLGTNHPFTDPKYGNSQIRMRDMAEIAKAITALTLTMNKHDIVVEGQKRGIPVAALVTPQEVLDDDHFKARGAFVNLSISETSEGRVPAGYLEIDGARAGIRSTAPAVGEHNAAVFSEWRRSQSAAKAFTVGSTHRPLAGLRVLDLGVIVAGAELGRLLSDQGAEVLKVEYSAFPDGARQGSTATVVSFSFAQGHRSQESVGINLRSPEGIDLFKQLAAQSDIILSNFKPGTMESLGIGYDVISKINPRIVMADSSTLGNTGPLAKSMGYGPLVRASTGLTALWSYPDKPGSFCDGITIVPDHFAARVSAVGVLAQLIARRRTNTGGTVSVSQAETILTALTTEYLHESLQPGSIRPRGNHGKFDAPDNVFRCAGDDDWCVIAIASDEQWRHLCCAIHREDLLQIPALGNAQGRLQHRELIEAAVEAWTCQHDAQNVMDQLQAQGIPAGKMFRLGDMEHLEHLKVRQFFRTLDQPGHSEVWPTENGPVRAMNLPDPDIRPAPLQGQHTRAVFARVLGLEPQQIETLIQAGILEAGGTDSA
jgi:crotonobetainyl-CoA:carnitine CoA-transferase CaiB-like acyl-CoA transferase